MGQTSGSTEIGAGVATSGTSKQFTQGSIQPTAGALDAAIEGNGVFVLRNNAGSTLYTRAGSFKFDGTGTLVTATGEKVQGWTAVNGILNKTGNIGDISITAVASQPPTATANMTLTANLDASAPVNATFSTPLQVVDSLGVTHILTYTFTKTGSNAWDYDISIPGEDITGGTAGTPTSLANGSLAFDSAGKLTSPLPAAPVSVKTTTGLVSGATDLDIDLVSVQPGRRLAADPVRADLRGLRHLAGWHPGGAAYRHHAGRRRNPDGDVLQRKAGRHRAGGPGRHRKPGFAGVRWQQ